MSWYEKLSPFRGIYYISKEYTEVDILTLYKGSWVALVGGFRSISVFNERTFVSNNGENVLRSIRGNGCGNFIVYFKGGI